MFFLPGIVIPTAFVIFVIVFILIVVKFTRKSVGNDAKELYKTTSEIASEIEKTINNSTYNSTDGKLKTCDYCGGSYEGDKCSHCGARNVK